MKILVTGANGYLGKHVVNKLVDMGYTVYASDLNFNGINEKAIKVYEPIFSEKKDIYKLVGSPDICIHLAWRDGFVHESENHIVDLSKHYIFLKNMIENGLKHLVVMGTMHEVGYYEGKIDENTPTNPLSKYGIAKNTLRQLLQNLERRNEFIFQWLRAYYIIGDDLRGNSIFSKIALMESKGEKYFPFTTGENKYDFISIEELTNQIVMSSIQNEITGIINCCSGNPVKLKDKVEEFIKKNNFKIKLKYGVYPSRIYDSPEIWGDNSKIIKILNNK